MVDNINGVRAPSAQALSSDKSNRQAKDTEALTKSFEKLANKPELANQLVETTVKVSGQVKPQVAAGKSGLNKLQDAVTLSKDALQSIKKLSGSEGSESVDEASSESNVESVSEVVANAVDGPGKSQKSEIMQLAKDLDALKADIKALFESLKEKTDQVTVVDSNFEASNASPEDLNKVVGLAKEAGSQIRFKPKDALSAHNDKINPKSVVKLLSGDITSA